MELSGLSIIELKQLLARVNHDLKMNKPTIKRIKKNIAPIISEYAECNIIAQKFTIKVAKSRNKVKCQTFRNNKYSIANQGHQASITGKYGFFASPNKVSL